MTLAQSRGETQARRLCFGCCWAAGGQLWAQQGPQAARLPPVFFSATGQPGQTLGDQGRQFEHVSIRDVQETAKSGALSVKDDGASRGLSQFDGSDDYDALYNLQAVPTEDYTTPSTHVELHASTPSVGTPKVTKTEAVDGDEPPLNEDDDDDDLDDLDQEEEEPNTQHLVLALFDKVTRAKNRWKCMLKDGIMHLNNRDLLFNKATGEFEF